jgi:hypothetical protein
MNELIIPTYQVRASFNDKTVRVYQAFSHEIADAALKHGTFVSPPFSMSRMTWIKPSFLWMMYRSGWAEKDDRQRRVLAIDIAREGFEWAIANSCLSHCPEYLANDEWRRRKDSSPVVIQWDPEKDINLRPLKHRAIQIGVGGVAVKHYVGQWIQESTDITDLATTVHRLVDARDYEAAYALLPDERPYSIDIDHILPVREHLGS